MPFSGPVGHVGVLWIVSLVLLSQDHLSAQPPSIPDPPKSFSLDQDTQILAASRRGEQGALQFEGQVVLRHQGLIVRSEALRQTQEGLEASGAVRLSAFSGSAALFAMADKATIGPGMLALKGSVRLQRPGGNRIEGVGAVVDLTRQTIEVEAPKGRISILARQPEKTTRAGGRK